MSGRSGIERLNNETKRPPPISPDVWYTELTLNHHQSVYGWYMLSVVLRMPESPNAAEMSAHLGYLSPTRGMAPKGKKSKRRQPESVEGQTCVIHLISDYQKYHLPTLFFESPRAGGQCRKWVSAKFPYMGGFLPATGFLNRIIHPMILILHN
jgi:hypothetical protein